MATAFDNELSPPNDDFGSAAADAPKWSDLKGRIAKRRKSRDLSAIWPTWEETGAPIRWGYAAAAGKPCSLIVQALTMLAAGRTIPKRWEVDFTAAAEAFNESLGAPGLDANDQLEALAWAYALPLLAETLDERMWWQTLNRLQMLQHAAAEQAASDSLAKLMLGGEMGLVLAWQLADVPSCKPLMKSAVAAAIDWFDRGEEAIDAALVDAGAACRLTLAAALRTRCFLKTAGKRRLKSAQTNLIWELATWAAATTHPDGTAVFSTADRAAVREDVTSNGLLFTAAAELDAESLIPAVKAALGQSKSRGRLAWQVSLPEPTLNSETARLAVMLPEWDVRRGRVHLDYRDDAFRVQVQAGRPMLLDGPWEVTLTSDGEELAPRGPWVEICHHTDDDVHYLELEQSWTGNVVLQRQIMVVRDDRCVMLADAVVANESAQPTKLEYTARWSVDAALKSEPEADTWEMVISDTKPRALAIPLALPEWRVGPRHGSFHVDQEGALVMQVQGERNLYAPLWIDMERKRFAKPRTWRQLTVAEFLRIVGRDEAVAFRVQGGDDQWLVYRSMVGRLSRTALGKNLVADFYCGRFDEEDGYVEELVTVDNDPDDE